MRINVSVDFTNIYSKFDGTAEKVKYVVTEQVVKDSNFYAPEDTKALQRSALTASNYKSGKVIWDVPYASKLYWNPSLRFSTDKNPNAQAFWFETAKSNFLSVWVAIGQAEVDGYV